MATATTSSLINRALREINVLAVGETPDPDESTDAIQKCNEMLDSWSNDSVYIPYDVHENFTSLGQGSYTIGDGGDLDTVRPVLIKSLRYRDGAGTESKVKRISQDQFTSLGYRSGVTSWPRYYYYETTHPLATLYLSDVDIADDYTIKLISQKPLSALPALTTEIDLPPGYLRLIRLGLAIELAGEYGKEVSQALMISFREAYESIKKANTKNKPVISQIDGGILSRSGRYYDVNSGPA